MTYQLTAPLLDACVLGIVDKEDAYGYTLTQQVREIVDISESTLYPVLRRLQKEALLATYDAPYNGRNRRYYRITENGKRRLSFYQTEWEEYKTKIDRLISEKEVEADGIPQFNEMADILQINRLTADTSRLAPAGQEEKLEITEESLQKAMPESEEGDGTHE